MTDNYLVVDVETLPLESSLQAPYPTEDRSPPINYSKPEAIASWRAKDEAAWREGRIKECSLSPRLGRIAALGSKHSQMDGTNCWTAGNEVGMLEEFWEYVQPGTTIVTFNGSFDLRFLVTRSLIHGITPKHYNQVPDWFRRYSIRPHFDCRAVLTGWDDRQSGKLHEWAEAFGLPVTDTTSGADVYRLAQEGNWQAIANHCKADVDLTDALYLKIREMFT